MCLSFCQCKKQKPKFMEFKSIKFCFLDKPVNGLVYIDNVSSILDEKVLEFCYCLTEQYDINFLKIESDIYYITALWANDKKGITLYKFKSKLVDSSKSENEVILEKQIEYLLKSNDGVNYIPVVENIYGKTFQCNDTL